MWVGLGMIVAEGAGVLAMGRLTDLVYGHIKLTLILLMSGSAACFYWFFLLTCGSIPVTTCTNFFMYTYSTVQYYSSALSPADIHATEASLSRGGVADDLPVYTGGSHNIAHCPPHNTLRCRVLLQA